MYYISKNENNTVEDVYSDAVYLPSGVATFPITEDEFNKINVSGDHSTWQYIGGIISALVSAEAIAALDAQAQVNDTSQRYLADTDWYVTRRSDTGVAIPADVDTARAEARLAIVEGV